MTTGTSPEAATGSTDAGASVTPPQGATGSTATTTTTTPGATSTGVANPNESTAGSSTKEGSTAEVTKAPDGSTPPAFKLPDAYKDKPWAAKIKTEEDLYKQIDTLDALKGKKTVVPDFKTATPKEVEDYLAQTRPESKDAYEFAEGTEEPIKAALSESLFKHGITAHQANAVIKEYQQAEAQVMEAQYSPEGMNSELEKSFGAEWKQTGGNTAKVLKQNLSGEDAAMMDKLPNVFLGLVYRMANNLIKGYGITESGAHTDAGAGKVGGGAVNIDTKISEARTKLAGLTSKPHTEADKQAIINEINGYYQQKIGKK